MNNQFINNANPFMQQMLQQMMMQMMQQASTPAPAPAPAPAQAPATGAEWTISGPLVVIRRYDGSCLVKIGDVEVGRGAAIPQLAYNETVDGDKCYSTSTTVVSAIAHGTSRGTVYCDGLADTGAPAPIRKGMSYDQFVAKPQPVAEAPKNAETI